MMLANQKWPESPGTHVTPGLLAIVASGSPLILLGHDRRGRERCVFAADAEHITADCVNIMVRLGKGVVACAVDADLAATLGLSMIPQTRVRTDAAPLYMRSVEANIGVTTGISAADRAATLRMIGAADSRAGDLVSPGHIMPNLVPDGAHCNGPLHDAILPLLRTVGAVRAVAWCDILDDDGNVAEHDFVTSLATQQGFATICATPLSLA